jgi:O-antigen ligase
VTRSMETDRGRLAGVAAAYPVHLLAAVTAVLCGASVAEEQHLSSPTVWSALLICLLVSAYLAITLTIDPKLLFTAWLFVAPFFQQSALAETTIAKDLGRVLYVYPPLVFALLLILRGISRPVRGVDLLPALYFAYILVSTRLISNQPQTFGSDLHHLYVTVGIGIILYYFVALGPPIPRLGQRLGAALIGSGSVLAAMAIVEGLTGWNLYHDTFYWRGHGIARAVATMANPAVLGTFLGMGLAFAIAILLWKGPETLRTPSKAFIALSVPALYFTYTRGPIIAIAAVGVAMAIFATRARWPSILLLVVAAATVFTLWSSFTSSSIYQARFGNTHNIQTRVVLQKASFMLAEQRPIFGWGYGSFNTVKNEADLQTEDPAALAYNTSHNTFLTVLVELGTVGLAILLLPWFIIGGRAISAARRISDTRWLFAGVIGALFVYAISVCTYDARFFSFLPALPWILLGVARRALSEEETQGA